jgi:hypothetical protein
MLTKNEVVEIMKAEIPAMLHSRIADLESMVREILCDYQCAASCAEHEGYNTDYAEISEKAERLLSKGIV